jgi:hypothetical protein
VIETNNQSEVGTKVFFSKSFKRSTGKVMSVKFANNDPYFFVLLQLHKVTFFRIDPDTGDVPSIVCRSRSLWRARARFATTTTSSSVLMTHSCIPAPKMEMFRRYRLRKVLDG